VNPDEVVALGAAIQGSILSGEVDHTLLLDVVPLSLGIETMGGVVSKFIPRNSTIPCATSELYTTYVDHQTGVDIHILQGERELVKDCRSLGRFRLKIQPQPAGVPKIRVTFLMDANGILQVKATDEKTKAAATLDVKPTFGLSDSEVETMLKAAWENAEQDFAARQLVESKNQAETLIRAVEKSLESPLLDKAYRAQQEHKILPVVRALKEDVKGQKADLIVTRTKELDFITQDLAQTILNLSVQSRLTNERVESVSI
jgi:molecular chaperone DnaK (HSP70)